MRARGILDTSCDLKTDLAVMVEAVGVCGIRGEKPQQLKAAPAHTGQRSRRAGAFARTVQRIVLAEQVV